MMKEEFINKIRDIAEAFPVTFDPKFIEAKIRRLDDMVFAGKFTLYKMIEYIYTFNPMYDDCVDPKVIAALWYLTSSTHDICNKYDEVEVYHTALEDADKLNNRIATLKGGLISV